MPGTLPQTGASALPSRPDLLALAHDIARLSGPSPAMDFRIAELFDLAPDPDSYGSELTPFGNGFDWRAPAFTSDPAAVGDLARHLGHATERDSPAAPALQSLLSLLLRAADRG